MDISPGEQQHREQQQGYANAHVETRASANTSPFTTQPADGLPAEHPGSLLNAPSDGCAQRTEDDHSSRGKPQANRHIQPDDGGKNTFPGVGKEHRP